jgi:ribosomal protein L31
MKHGLHKAVEALRAMCLSCKHAFEPRSTP